MPIEIRTHAEELIKDFTRKRIPEGLEDKIRILHKTRGCVITLIEERPHFMRPGLWTLFEVAQFRYKPSTGIWTLYCRDRHHKWWRFTPEPPSRDLAALIRAVDEDPTCIFWG
ncbi:MAG: DUF3024 domain-containing protein [Candidatus Coatesbacteria bacterium]